MARQPRTPGRAGLTRSTRRRPAPSRAPASTRPGRRPAWRAAARAARRATGRRGRPPGARAMSTSGSTWTAWRSGAISNSTATCAQLLDGPRPAGVAPPHERDRLAPPLDEGRVERVLQHGRVAVVVLRGEDHVAVGPVDDAAERGPRPRRRSRGRSAPAGRRRRRATGGRAGPPARPRTRRAAARRPVTQAATRSLNRPSPGGARDDLHQHDLRLSVPGRGLVPRRDEAVAGAGAVFNLTAN